MAIDPLRLSLLDIVQNYGQKAIVVLKTAINIAKSNRLKGIKTPGDFDYRSLVEALASSGFSYNPSLLLRALERKYGIIETSYKSSNQHWYIFKDLEGLERALSSFLNVEEVDDPVVTMLRIQFRSVKPRYWLNRLRNMSVKEKLSEADVKLFEKFAFRVLPKIVSILRRIEEYEDHFYAEIGMLKEILNMALLVAERIDVDVAPLLKDGVAELNRVEDT